MSKIFDKIKVKKATKDYVGGWFDAVDYFNSENTEGVSDATHKSGVLHDVVNRRELLLAFAKWFIQQENINSTRPDTYVDDFLESQ